MSDKTIVRQCMEIKDKQKRIDMASILFAEGYAVRELAVKPVGGKGTKKYYVEYWKEAN